MKTLLILAYECAPYHRPGSTIGAQRPNQFAKHLPAFGWRCVVLCCDFELRYTLNKGDDWQDQIDKKIGESLRDTNGPDRIIIPLPSLQYNSWADKVWHRAVAMDPHLGTFSAKPGLINRILRRIATVMKLFTGDHSESWQPVAVHAGKILCNRLKIDMIMAEHSPDASVFAASALHRRLKIPWIIDFRDPMMRDLNKVARSIYGRFTIPNFRSVVGTINVNGFWTKQDEKLFRSKSCVIQNGFDPDDFKSVKAGQSNDELTIGYFGSIQTGQQLTLFLRALSQLPDHLKVKFVYRGNLNNQIVDFFTGSNLSNVEVDSQSSVPREEALSLMASCDVLLLLSLKIRNDRYLKKGLIPGKTFEYFALRKPILVVSGDDGLLNDLIRGGNCGRIGEDERGIVLLIEEAYSQKKNNAKIWNIVYDENFREQFTRERQTETLKKFMESLL